MAVGAPPLPPQAGISRVNPDGTPTQAQIDYERQFSKWVSDYISSIIGGALPFPTPTTLGGVKSATAPTHQFQRGIDGTGSPIFGQPAAADITGLGPFATGTSVPAASVTGLATVATSGLASDLIGTLGINPPTPTALGGIYSSSAPAFSFATGVDTSGNLQYRQPAFTDIAGALSALTIGTHLTGGSYNGSAAVTIATDATDANTASAIVARDASGNFSAGTINAALTGAASLNLLKTNNLSDLSSAKTARSSSGLNIEAGTAHGNSDYTVLSTDRWVYTNANFTAPRTWTLPAASSLNAGQSIIIDDLQNTLTATNTLTIARAGSDLINALSTLVLNVAGMRCVLISDGTSKWTATLSLTGVTGTGSVVLSNSPAISGTATFAGASFNSVGTTSLTVSGTGSVSNLTATTATIGTLTANTVGSGFANLSNTTAAAQLHLSGTGNDEGGYFVGYGTNSVVVAGGMSFDGTNWLAKATTGAAFTAFGGQFYFTSDSGLTVGSAFSPTTRFNVDATGTIVTGIVPVARLSGTLSATSLPNPSATTLGGVKSLAAVSHKFLTSIGTDGLPVAAQPVVGDVTGAAASGANSDITSLSSLTSTTWTPVLQFGGASTGITYSTQSGTIMTMGKLVIAQLKIVLTSKGSATGAATISGLSANTQAQAAPILWTYYQGMSAVTSPGGFVSAGGTLMNLYQTGAASSTQITDTNFTNASQLYIAVIYIAA